MSGPIRPASGVWRFTGHMREYSAKTWMNLGSRADRGVGLQAVDLPAPALLHQRDRELLAVVDAALGAGLDGCRARLVGGLGDETDVNRRGGALGGLRLDTSAPAPIRRAEVVLRHVLIPACLGRVARGQENLAPLRDGQALPHLPAVGPAGTRSQARRSGGAQRGSRARRGHRRAGAAAPLA